MISPNVRELYSWRLKTIDNVRKSPGFLCTSQLAVNKIRASLGLLTCASCPNPSSARPIPLLFIHGAMHGAWCWDVHFLDYFAQHGFGAHAVNLRGHGKSEGSESLRWTRISEFVEDVVNAVQQLASSPILIGHSKGGFIIQKYLENHTAPAAVLLSSAPTAGFLPAAIRVSRRRPLTFAKVNVTRSLFPLVATPDLARESFFSDELSGELLLKYWEQMQDDSYRALLDMAALDLPKPAKGKLPL